MAIKVRKNKGTDYGLYCFRLSETERNELDDLIDKAKAEINKDKKDDEYMISKGQILYEAIKLGLPLVKKKR